MLGQLRLCVVVEQQRAPASSSHYLVSVEAENANPPESPCVAFLVERTERLCGIFNHFQLPTTAKFNQRIQIDRMTERVHGNHGLDPSPRKAVTRTLAVNVGDVTEIMIELCRIHTESGKFTVNEVRSRPTVRDGVCSRHKRQSWNQDFVAGFNTGEL